jgi:polyribonucleotide 5'-hydroxyl-kinase
VIRLDKSGGCVDRSEDYMKALRHAQVREYFFGHGENTLAPSSQTCDFGDLNIFQIVEGMVIRRTPTARIDTDSVVTGDESALYRSGDYDEYDPSNVSSASIYTRVTPSHTDSQDVIRDSSVKGYIYVADVDEVKKKVRLLSPQPGMIPGNAMVLGSWPEDVPGLVG